MVHCYTQCLVALYTSFATPTSLHIAISLCSGCTMVSQSSSSFMDYTKNDTKTVSVRFVGTIPSESDPRRIIADNLSSTVPTEKWTWLYRKERYHIWYVTTETDIQAEALASLQTVKVSDTLSLCLTNCGRERLHMRVHWLPATVPEAAICNHFGHCGTVIAYSEEKVELLGLKNIRSGVREVTIDISERKKDRLPHRLNIAGCPALLTFRGRPPLCLKCGEVGHVRGKCPYRRPVSTTQDSPPPTAAQRVMNAVIARQRGKIDVSDDDLDLDKIQAESLPLHDTPITQSDFFTHSPTTSLQVAYGYSDEQPLSPDAVDMDMTSAARKAVDAIELGTTAKRVRTCQPLDTEFPISTVPREQREIAKKQRTSRLPQPEFTPRSASTSPIPLHNKFALLENELDLTLYTFTIVISVFH